MARRRSKDRSINSRNDASCINNKRGMARRAKRNSNKRDRQYLAKDTAVLSLEVGTMQTLWEAAGYNQKKIYQAEKAIEWIKAALDMRCSAQITNETTLKFFHETYGPYINDYENKFKQFAWANNQCCADGVWTASTPFGDFTIILEYFDNHCTGY